MINCHFEELPKIFNMSYVIKKGGILNAMDFLKPKGGNKLSRLISLDSKAKDFRTNPF